MGEPWQLRMAELEQVGRYTYLLAREDGKIPLRVVVSEGPRADDVRRRSLQSAALRRFLPEDLYLTGLFGRLHHEGWCELDGRAIHCLITEFIPGVDLTALSRPHPPAASLAGLVQVVKDLSLAFSQLHALDPDTAGLGGGNPAQRWQRWHEHISRWVWTMGRYVADAPSDVMLGELSVRRAQDAIARVEPVIEQLFTVAATDRRLSILHNDAHGGNFVAAALPGEEQQRIRLTGILDERLRVGDPLFDLAALMDWALEIFEPEDYLTFCDLLTHHYGLSSPSEAQLAKLWIYHLERSLGRMAYYLPHSDGGQRAYTEAEVVTLKRHLPVLELLAGTADRQDRSVCWLTLPSSLSLGWVRK